MIRLPQQETKTLVAIHGWAGTALGLLLYAVIVTGTVAVSAQEIRIWSSGALQTESPLHSPIHAALRRVPSRPRNNSATMSRCASQRRATSPPSSG